MSGARSSSEVWKTGHGIGVGVLLSPYGYR